MTVSGQVERDQSTGRTRGSQGRQYQFRIEQQVAFNMNNSRIFKTAVGQLRWLGFRRCAQISEHRSLSVGRNNRQYPACGRIGAERAGSTFWRSKSSRKKRPHSPLPHLPTKRARPPNRPTPTAVLQADPPGTILRSAEEWAKAASIKSFSTRVMPPLTAPVCFRNASFSWVSMSTRADPTPTISLLSGLNFNCASMCRSLYRKNDSTRLMCRHCGRDKR